MNITDVIEQHVPNTASGVGNQGQGSAHRYCKCGLKIIVNYEEMADGDFDSTPYLDRKLAEHIADEIRKGAF